MAVVRQVDRHALGLGAGGNREVHGYTRQGQYDTLRKGAPHNEDGVQDRKEIGEDIVRHVQHEGEHDQALRRDRPSVQGFDHQKGAHTHVQQTRVQAFRYQS